MTKTLTVLVLCVALLCSATAALAVDYPSDVSKLPSLGSMPFIKSVAESGGKVTVTLSTDAFANARDGISSDLYVSYYDVNGDWQTLFLGDEGTAAEGSVYTFILGEGATLDYVRLSRSETDDNASFYGYEYDNGYRRESYTSEDVEYYYTYFDGVLAYVAVYTLNSDGTWAYNGFNFDENGDLYSYDVEVAKNYTVVFGVDGLPLSASFYDAENYRIYNWNAELGWYDSYYDEELGKEVYFSTAGPEGVADPTSFQAPYVSRAKDAVWYGNNTVGVLGLSLRDDLGLTDRWYNVAPVDLTAEGTQIIPMVASNMFFFGTATVTVADDSVTVNYTMPKGHAYLKSECLQWFTSLDEISADFLNDPQGRYAFGEPVSISEELNGQEAALLFICNRVTYRQPITDNGGMLTRYYNTQERWANWRAALTELLDGMEAVE